MPRSTLKILAANVVTLSLISACAPHPDAITPAYVSPLQYSNSDCDQLKQELIRVNRKVMEVSGVQERTANKDSVAMGVGLIIFWPALLFLAGGDNRKEELARLKGEYDCLEELAIQKKCDIAPELEAARKARQEQANKQKDEEKEKAAQMGF